MLIAAHPISTLLIGHALTSACYRAILQAEKGGAKLQICRFGGEGDPVVPAVFKTVVSLNGDGWVRLPFTSANF